MSAPAASWCDPTGESPAQVRGSARLVASVAWPLATGVAKAYTTIAWGVGLSHERSDIAEAESLYSLEGNMCSTAMRGADALPASDAIPLHVMWPSTPAGTQKSRDAFCTPEGPARLRAYALTRSHRRTRRVSPRRHCAEPQDDGAASTRPANR